ncbi:PHD finger protein 20 isoform X1 [Syngnathus scovelli]|uniref:PHD finger protein 20 isoform X1 n=1 Tax=Syngnathus scovelli TaxID=161590 RepID=UPI00210F6EE2|nr:PHD finger protein 20 isoform X1 [Syngnathus scovelli]XP_049608304.1 PHD finger protein 20 isoform X1 [Syngnathus scovelli]XP_049608305.1 PHD finger protein 20 isoform X1 [Syngnathus scovelli]XP_049608306.1 PHD finger protein 20 isoform X1 [Syngnathus scovelli]
MKTPPKRPGIKFEVGAQLQARDRHKTWYSATIDKVDYDKERVLIHYRRWSRRHDEWFHWNSPYLRPLERVTLRRRRGLNLPSVATSFATGTKVLACWTDCRFYPAKILRVNKDESYTVRFYDGVVRTVKPPKVKALQKKSKCGKSAMGSEGLEEGESEEECEEDEREDDEEEEEKEDEKAEGESGPQPSSSSSSFPPPAAKSLPLSPGGNSDTHEQPITSELSQPAVPSHIDKDVLLERQAHLPTSHKFSREPLYRVIKNQPPPILSIELDHNPFKCPSAGCTKSFRKASLLHYHIKYYHAEEHQQQEQQQQQPEEQGSPAVTDMPRRKRSTSESSHFLYDMASIASHDDREHRSMLTAEIKREKSHLDRKERKNFLRVKLKKKKKKKKKKKMSQSEVCSSDNEGLALSPVTFKLGEDYPSTRPMDDGSDWSTLTAESGEDAPSWSLTAGAEDCEVVRCVCEVDEENDFMIQCESCLCWQHGTCMGLYENNVPRNYTCYYCRHCTGWRRTQCYLSEPDLLTSGRMFGLSFVRDNYSESNTSKIAQTSGLLAHTHDLNQVLSGLQLKISLLRTPSHPDLQLWRLPWTPEEGHKPRGEAPVSYVSSEHCYQKPGSLWEKVEERPKATVKQETPNEEDKEIKEEDDDDDESNWPGCAQSTKRTCPNGDEGHADSHLATSVSSPASVTECQLNLLEHVERLHQQIITRMDVIEKDLDILESWLDHSGELEPPEPLSRLPQLKQRIKRLLYDLSVVRRLSVRQWHSS